MSRFVLSMWLCALAVPAVAGDLPDLVLKTPAIAAKYSNYSNIVIDGTVSPPIETDVRIELYEVRAKGRLFRLVGTTAIIDDHGRFAANLLPSAHGWPIGELKAVATVSDLAQVKQARTFVAVKLHEVPQEGYETKESVDSGIVLDTEQPNGPFQVIAGQTFLIRGRFNRMDGLFGNQGPKVNATIVLPESPGRPGEIVCQSAVAISLPKDNLDHFWYEIQILAPTKNDDYKLRIEHNRHQPVEPQAPDRQPKDGFDLQIGAEPVKTPEIKK